MSDTATPAAAATRDAARCNRCGQNHPQHPTDPAHAEVHPIQWTGGYGSTFPGDLMRVTLALCEFCTMVLCAELRVPPEVASVWIGGGVYRSASTNEVRALQGFCLADEEAALLMASTPDPAALRGHAHLAGYLAHRRAFGDPRPDLTQRVAEALSAVLDAEGSAWRSAEGITDAHQSLCAFGVSRERACELRGLVRELAAGNGVAS